MSRGTDILLRERSRGVKDLLLRIQGSSRGSSSTPKLSTTYNNFHNSYTSFQICPMSSTQLPTTSVLPTASGLSIVDLVTVVWLGVLYLLLTTLVLWRWLLGRRPRMELELLQMSDTSEVLSTIVFSCSPALESSQRIGGRVEGVMGTLLSSETCSEWDNSTGTSIKNLPLPTSDPSDTLQPWAKNC